MVFVLSVALIGLVSWTPSANATFYQQSVRAKINIPDLPQSVKAQGKVIDIPKGPITTKNVPALLIKMRQSEAANARAVRIAQQYHAQLQRTYSQPVNIPTFAGSTVNDGLLTPLFRALFGN
jgi:hypothetical protein